MPDQVRAGSFLVVAPTLSEAIKLFDSLDDTEGVTIRDMEGREINVDRFRTILNEGDLS